MKSNFDELVQWAGALFVVLGHSLNAIGPSVYPWNILGFLIGTSFFFIWSIRMANKPQLAVNIVALAIGLFGLWKALI
jgi:hypothetical protein